MPVSMNHGQQFDYYSPANSKILTVGRDNVQNTEFDTTAQTVDVRYANRIYPIEKDGQDESTALYGRIDQELNKNRWLMYLEVTDGGLGTSGADASGGGIKAFHSGNSDFLDVIIMDGTDSDVQPVGVEVASYKPGSRNFISTLQYLSGSPVDCANTVFYSALVDSSVVSSFGQMLFQKTPGHAITAQLYDGVNGGGGAALPGQACFRIVETDYARNLWTVFNSGRTDLSATDALSGAQTNDSPELTLIGTYWTGSASQDRSFQILHSMTATTPNSGAFFKIGNLNSEVTALIIRNNNGTVTHDYQSTSITTLQDLTMEDANSVIDLNGGDITTLQDLTFQDSNSVCDFQGGNIVTLQDCTFQDANSLLNLNGGDISNIDSIACKAGGGSLDLQGGPISNVTTIDGSSYARMTGFAADGDPGGLAGVTMSTNVTGFGDGTATNLTALAKGGGSGPAAMAATGFMKAYVGATVVYVPYFE